ncbi:MAG TPA: hypothetical protein VFJ82_12420 [Longimicrobium sp.]|nr:hypothetical protein [Longimicrobium sp.]
MDTLLEAGRHALEGIEVLFALATAGLLSVGLVHAHQAAQRGAPDASRPALPADTAPDAFDHAA